MPQQSSARASKSGLPAGTPVYTGSRRVERPVITVMDYDAENLEILEDTTLEQCVARMKKPSVTWVDVSGIEHVKTVAAVCEAFGVHALAIEDIVSITGRPKADDYGGFIYVLVKDLNTKRNQEDRIELESEQMSLVLGDGFVLTFQERPGDSFEPIRTRLHTKRCRLRTSKADYLAFALLDAIVDNYFVVLDAYGDVVERLEDDVPEKVTPETLHSIHGLKRELRGLRKLIAPVREVVTSLTRLRSALISETALPYFRDLADHVLQATESVDIFREMAVAMVDLYMSEASNRMNEVMKVLTIVTSVFIPLSFITGLYGMNFDNMPELHWSGGYYAVLAVMATMTMALAVYVQSKKWL